MSRVLLIILIAIHGLIHLMGFVKAFNLAEIKELTQPVSKGAGVFWLLAFILFTVTLLQFFFANDRWWLTGMIAVILSQLLIITAWGDAKFGTIANILLLPVLLVAMGEYRFHRTTSSEISEIFASSRPSAAPGENSITNLPLPVANWIRHSGAMNQPKIETVRLRQKARMKMKPEQTEWTKASAVQYFTVNPPAFLWKVGLEMMPMVPVTGRDKFVDGHGEMQINLLSLVPVVDVRNDEKIHSAALQRFLSEIIWFPSAALMPYVQWREIDAYRVEATMTWNGSQGACTFVFSEQGDLVSLHAMRYMGSGSDAKLLPWNIRVHEIGEFNGIRVPIKCTVSWQLDDGPWDWLELDITEIEYNQPTEYVTNGPLRLSAEAGR
jgi:hypothetical protein